MTAQTPYRFFLQHAGFSYDPQAETRQEGRRRCAKALAAAERLARECGCSFTWEIDPDVTSSSFDDDPEPWALWVCDLRDAHGTRTDSLGGIDFGRDGEPWGDPYRRVVEAELALDWARRELLMDVASLVAVGGRIEP